MVAPRPDDVQLQAKHPVSEEALFRRSGGVKELLYTLKYSHGRIAAWMLLTSGFGARSPISSGSRGAPPNTARLAWTPRGVDVDLIKR